MKLQTLTTALALGLAATTAWSAKTKIDDAPIALPSALGFDETTTATRLKAFADKRKPAREAGSVGEKDLSESFKKFRDRFLQAKTPTDIENLLIEGDKNFDSYDMDLQFFLAQAELARPFRSIVYRGRPLFEKHKYRTIQSLSVATIRGVSEDLRIFLPTEQWDAIFEYFTAPFPAADAKDSVAKNTQFNTPHDVQVHLMRAAPELAKAIGRISKIYHDRPKNRALVWDNKLFFGPASFADDLDRYAAFGDAEISATLANLNYFLHNAYVFAAYNQEDSLEVNHDLGQLVGLDGFEFWGDVGPTSQERTKIIQKHSQYLTLNNYTNVSGPQLLDLAFQHLKIAASYTQACWNYLQASDDAASKFSVLNPGEYKASRREIDLRLKTVKDMLAGPTTVRSVVTGETANIDLPSLYHNPVSDLKAFLPTKFDTDSGQERQVELPEQGKVKYRNYFYGRAIGWDNKAWSKFSSSVKNPEDPQKLIRILNQSFGGDTVAPIAYLFAR